MKGVEPFGSESFSLRRPPRCFTVDQANRALPLVERIVADIVEQFTQAHLLRERSSAGGGGSGPDETVQLEIEALGARLERLIGELGPIGCQLKDPRIGLIDFPAVRDGRPILLCWKHGEPRIAFWHEVDAGFAGRRPIDELSAGDA